MVIIAGFGSLACLSTVLYLLRLIWGENGLMSLGKFEMINSLLLLLEFTLRNEGFEVTGNFSLKFGCRELFGTTQSSWLFLREGWF